ncbi:T9SS type A sorting domain-containing protein [candidate division WOR-3 bacterium]|nr:T9SS type A sorting domain-containing protein [candidate division WOR-3 bacterium]
MSKKVIGIVAAIVMLAIVVPGITAQTILLEEDFEETTWPPSVPGLGSWTTGFSSGVDNWNYNTYWGREDQTQTPSGTDQCADNDDDANYPPSYQNVENYLASPAFDGTGFNDITFEYDMCYRSISSSHQVRIEVWDGDSWVVIASYNSSEGYTSSSSHGVHHFWHINDFANPEMQVRYVYTEGYQSWAWYFEIDNVTITGTGGGGPSEEVDLEMVQILRPFDEETGGEAFKPACRIFNNYEGEQPSYLEATLEAVVRCRIKDMTTLQTVYEDVLQYVPLEYGYNEINGFKFFTPESNKNYEILFVVEHEDDVNEQNNDKTMRFNTAAGVTVDATDILAPAGDDQQGPFSPSAAFTADDEADATGVTLHCKIEDAVFNAIVFEEEKGPVDITAGDSYNETFTEVSDLIDGSAYTITFWATINKSSAGEEISKTFNYIEAVAENPIIEAFGLKVAGSGVTFSLGSSTDVSLKVYDVAGNVVAALASGSWTAGSHSVNIEGLESGVYFVKLVTPFYTDAAKVMIIK